MAKTRKICLLIDCENWNEREVFKGVTEFANEKKRDWELYTEQGVTGLPLSELLHLKGDGVIGFIREEMLATEILRENLPAVNVSDDGNWPGIWNVRRDFPAVASQVAEYLIKRGFRNFGYIGGGTNSCHGKEFQKQIAKYNYTSSIFSQPRNASTYKNWISLQDGVMDWLRRGLRPAGVWCEDDRYGARILSACRKLRIRVPQDVAVVGMNNDSLICDYTVPTLTSIEISWKIIGYEAAVTLDKMLRGAGKSSETKYIQSRGILERQSTQTLIVNDPLIIEAVKYIEAHACDPLFVQDLVEKLGVGRRQFEIRFQKALKRSPNTEILRIRIAQACNMLRNTDKPVAEIASLCGFAGHTSMDVVFRRILKISPTKYRQNNDFFNNYHSQKN